MKNNNIRHESIPSVPCGIALMPMKEVYQTMYGDVAIAQVRLANSASSKEIRNILQKIYEYPVDNRVFEQIRNMVKDIKGNVHSMHMYDYTRTEMCNDLSVLLTTLIHAIEEENRKQDVEEARRTFTFMADHAEEFVEWVNLMHQKQ